MHQEKMTPIIIDTSKCSGCEICVEICPYQAIKMEEGHAVVVLEDCFLCGHCSAVCPGDAVEISDQTRSLGLSTVTEVQKVVCPGTSSGLELVSLLRSRRSCRKYKSDPVELDKLTDLAKIGTTAPSGTNCQSWNFTILPTRSDMLSFGQLVADYYRRLNRQAANPLLRLLMKIIGGDSLGRYYHNYYHSVAEALRRWDEDGVDQLFHGAVAAILVTGKKSASCPAEDALLATQNILLAAHTMGLGSCLIGFGVEAMRRSPQMKIKMEIQGDEEIYSVIALGYPAVTFYRPASRKRVEPRVVTLVS